MSRERSPWQDSSAPAGRPPECRAPRAARPAGPNGEPRLCLTGDDEHQQHGQDHAGGGVGERGNSRAGSRPAGANWQVGLLMTIRQEMRVLAPGISPWRRNGNRAHVRNKRFEYPERKRLPLPRAIPRWSGPGAVPTAACVMFARNRSHWGYDTASSATNIGIVRTRR